MQYPCVPKVFHFIYILGLSQSRKIISCIVGDQMVSQLAGFNLHKICFNLYELFHFINFSSAVLRRLRSPTVRPRSKMSLSVSFFRSSIVKIVCLCSLTWVVCGILFLLIQSSNFIKEKQKVHTLHLFAGGIFIHSGRGGGHTLHMSLIFSNHF